MRHGRRELPGGTAAIGPVLGLGAGARGRGRVAAASCSYRTIAPAARAPPCFVEDITEARRREQELKVKEATIREVHHRVKNNLQTIASLLRIQARRSGSPEASRALSEAVERVCSMAVVHEMLSARPTRPWTSAKPRAPWSTWCDRASSGGERHRRRGVEGTTGDVPASTATSLALVTAELVHNAIEHGLGPQVAGHVVVSMRRLPDELHLVVRDDGVGLPERLRPRVRRRTSVWRSCARSSRTTCVVP